MAVEVTLANNTAVDKTYNLTTSSDEEDTVVDHLITFHTNVLAKLTKEDKIDLVALSHKLDANHLANGMKLSSFFEPDAIAEGSIIYDALVSELSVASQRVHLTYNDKSPTDFLDVPTFYDGVEYIPAIHTHKKLYRNLQKSSINDYIIAAGYFVNDADEVLAYRKGINEPFFLSESMADSLSIPIFVIDVGTVRDLEHDWPFSNEGDFDTSKKGTFIGQKMMGDELVMRSYRITRRFEGSGRSEFRVGSLLHRNRLAEPQAIETGNYSKNIKRRDIGDDISSATSLINFDNITFSGAISSIRIPATIEDRYFIYAYERDWINTKKLIVNPCASIENVLSQSVETNRKYSNEVYFARCGVTEIDFPVRNRRIDFGNAYYDEEFLIERTQ